MTASMLAEASIGGLMVALVFMAFVLVLVAGGVILAIWLLRKNRSHPSAAAVPPPVAPLPRTSSPVKGPCPQCGAMLPSGALEGLCPACLLKQGATDDTATQGGAQPFQPPAVEEIARMFPQLHVMEFIGKGGMGAVYKARQPALDRVVALKILPPQAGRGSDFVERFNREARALAKLSHPNIVAVHEFGQAEGMPFFIMEFVDGLNLRQLERAGRLAPREALQIVPQICEALQFAHDEGIVHRDIKPENILLDKKGRVKIADFGIAKIMSAGGLPLTPTLSPNGREGGGKPGEAATHAVTEQAIGTPNYMAPEQKNQPQSVDHRADIFSLGVVFYEMLTGELPVGKFAPPSRRVEVDVRLDAVVLRALEKEPERRYQQASDVKTMVETIATNPAAEPPALEEFDVRTWSPFQSPQVREICAHMTDEERGDAANRGMFWGLWCALSAFALVIGINTASRPEALRSSVGIFALVEVAAVLLWMGMQRRFLASTEWARKQGIEARSLPLFSFSLKSIAVIGTRDGVRLPNWTGITMAFVVVFAAMALTTVLMWLATGRAFHLAATFGIVFGISMAVVAGGVVRALGRGWKAAVLWVLLVPLVIGGLIAVKAFEAVRAVDAALVVHAPADIPGEQFTALGMTLGATRVFGSDRYVYRFQIRNAEGKIIRSTDVPIPFENDKLRTDPSAAPGSVADYYFGGNGRIEWAPDGSAVTFSIRGVELAHLQVDRFASTAAKGAFGIVHDVIIANGNVGNSFFSFDTGGYVAGPKDFDPASTAESDTQKLQPWLTAHDVDLFARRENGKPILAMSDMVIAAIDENDFDRFTDMEQVKANPVWRGAVDAQNRPIVQSVTRGAYGGKTTVAFQTRYDVVGVLQVVGVTSDPPGVKVRYKLVESTRPTPAVSSASGKSAAILPDGAFVELISLADFTGPTISFWNADGTLPTNHSDWSVAAPPPPNHANDDQPLKSRGFVFRWGGPGEPPVLQGWKFDGKEGAEGAFQVTVKGPTETPGNWMGLHQRFPTGQRTTTVSLRVASGPFSAKAGPGMEWGTSGQTPYGTFLVGDAFDRNGKAAVNITHDLKGCDFRLRARRSGQAVSATEALVSKILTTNATTATNDWVIGRIVEGKGGGNQILAVYEFPGLSARDIGAIGLEIRPVRWVELANVALDPGPPTQVTHRVVDDIGNSSAMFKTAQTSIENWPPQGAQLPQTDSGVSGLPAVKASGTLGPLVPPSADGANWRIMAHMSKADADRLRFGQRVTFSVEALPGRSFTGRVVEIDEFATAQNGMKFLAAINVKDSENNFKQGMFADVSLDVAPPAEGRQPVVNAVVERVLYSVATQKPTKGQDFDSGTEIEVPDDVAKSGEDKFFQWIAEHGIDMMAFGHMASWDLWTTLKLASMEAATWETADATKIRTALDSGVLKLELAEKSTFSGFRTYSVKTNAAMPMCLAFQTQKGSLGVIQITGFNESAPGVKIRYKVLESARE